MFNIFFALMFMIGVITTLTGFTMLLCYMSTMSFALI